MLGALHTLLLIFPRVIRDGHDERHHAYFPGLKIVERSIVLAQTILAVTASSTIHQSDNLGPVSLASPVSRFLPVRWEWRSLLWKVLMRIKWYAVRETTRRVPGTYRACKKRQIIGLMLCCYFFYDLSKCDSGRLSHLFYINNQVVKAGFKWVIKVYILSIKKKNSCS